MPWPNFLIIGAVKSGTTSLYHYLQQHPQIYMSSVKEPRFFALHGEQFEESRYDQFSIADFKRHAAESIINRDDYLTLFRDVKDEKAIGEASPIYLYSPQAAARIYRQIPRARLIAVLRNPPDRAYSHFLMRLRMRRVQTTDFLQALALEKSDDDSRPWTMPQYIRYGFYDTQLQRFLKIFPASQLRVFMYEDLRNPLTTLREIFRFLEVDENFQPNISTRYNTAAAKLKNPLWRVVVNAAPISIRTKLEYVLPPSVFRWYMSRRSRNLRESNKESQCPPEAREKLRPIFREHILRLQDLIHRDLSAWLE